MNTIIKNALENVKTNKIRVAIAMVWIVLGITSVVVVSSIGNGLSAENAKIRNKEDYRRANIVFSPRYDDSVESSFYQPFTQGDIDMVSLTKGVQLVTPQYGEGTINTTYGLISNNSKNMGSKLTQYDEDVVIDIKYGRKFSLEDLERDTVILDYAVAWRLFDEVPEIAIGKSVTINNNIYEVIGVTKEKKATQIRLGDERKEEECFLPKKALEKMAQGTISNSTITGLEVTIAKGFDPDVIVQEIVKNINELKGEKKGEERYYQGGGGNEEGFELRYMQSVIDRFTGVLTSTSLFIGGIGIMNIMYMSVSERQREIGIRRAIGATPKDILIQFLIETIVITFIGGLVGIIVGSFASGYASDYLGLKAIPDAITYVKAVGTSILMGAVFGLIPASRAAKLDPIKAIQG